MSFESTVPAAPSYAEATSPRFSVFTTTKSFANDAATLSLSLRVPSSPVQESRFELGAVPVYYSDPVNGSVVVSGSASLTRDPPVSLSFSSKKGANTTSTVVAREVVESLLGRVDSTVGASNIAYTSFLKLDQVVWPPSTSTSTSTSTNQPKNKLIITSNSTSFPFTFHLPSSIRSSGKDYALPPSFEGHGIKIEYSVQVTVKRDGFFSSDVQSVSPFAVDLRDYGAVAIASKSDVAHGWLSCFGGELDRSGSAIRFVPTMTSWTGVSVGNASPDENASEGKTDWENHR